MRTKSLFMAIAIAALMLSTPARAVDTDGDGLLDLLDLPRFDPSASGTVDYERLAVGDLDGANQLTGAQELFLNKNQITSLESGDFDGLNNLQALWLNGNQITSLESGDFDGLTSLQGLNLDFNKLTSIESGDFDGLNNLQWLELGGNRITSIDSGVFQGLNNLHELHLNSNQITNIKSGDFDGLSGLRALGLESNRIRSLESGDFDGLNNLQGLNLDFNKLTSIESGDFNGLNSLQSLKLGFNRITSIESGNFQGLTNLQALQLNSNQITSLESGDFDGLTKLQSLKLGFNQIASLESGDFDGLNNLQSLQLNSNQITRLESGAFDELTNLQSLELGFNRITRIESGAFQGLTNLQALQLNSNQITSLESGDFDELTNLQSLKLGFNQITSIDRGDFDGLDNVQFLELGFNRIRSLESEDFDGLNNLQELHLNSNQITSLESGTFKGLINMWRLDLADNQISTLKSGTFEGLNNLQSLDLSPGQFSQGTITSLESGAFQGLTNLPELRLGGNRITSLESGEFDGLNNLQALWLNGNQITSLESGDFDGLTNLQDLNLQYNQISSLESGDFDGLINVQQLDLMGNRISSLESGSFRGLNNLERIRLDDNRITSVESGAFQALHNLQQLDLRYNQIASLESGAFQGLNNLWELSLSGNQITRLESGDFDGLASLQTLYLEESQITSLESGAFQGLRNLNTLVLTGNDITELNFAGATFERLIQCRPQFTFPGLCVDQSAITELILDDAMLSRRSFNTIAAETGSITDVSLVGLMFSDRNPNDLTTLLDIESLDNVTVSQTLFDLYADEFNSFATMDGNTVTVVPDLGDYNANGILDAGDLDLQAAAIQEGLNPDEFDMTYDRLVDAGDRTKWVHKLKQTWFGDADLDGEFNSTDLGTVLAAGEYEDDVDFNSSWGTGDFNADGDFDSSDLSMALADGGYEQGPRGATAAVPEPSAIFSLLLGLLSMTVRPLLRTGTPDPSLRRGHSASNAESDPSVAHMGAVPVDRNATAITRINTMGRQSMRKPFRVGTSLAPHVQPLSMVIAVLTMLTLGIAAPLRSEITTFAVIGDYGSGSLDAANVARMVKRWHPDFIATTGDNNYLGSDDYDVAVGQFYQEFVDSGRFFPAIGNHDNPSDPEEYVDYFDLPGNEIYYDVVVGNIHLFMYDNNFGWGSTVDQVEQDEWLRHAASSSTADWKFLMAHQPRAADSERGDHVPEDIILSQGIDAYFAGHNHYYQRGELTESIPSFIIGNSGWTLRHFVPGTDEPEAFYNDDYGALRVLIDGTNATFEFWSVANGGTLIDRYLMPGPPGHGVPGEYNGDDVLDAVDIDLQALAMKETHPYISKFDENGDGLVNGNDREIWVRELRKTYFGDADLDGEFSSSDLVDVFKAAEYEDDLPLNSSWRTGDWNGDGDFDANDLLVALADGGYEQGPRLATAVVPEPTSLTMLCIGMLMVGRRHAVFVEFSRPRPAIQATR